MSGAAVADFNALAFSLAGLLAVGAGIYKSRCARDRVHERYYEAVAETRAAVEGDQIIPALADLVSGVAKEAKSRRQPVSATLLDRGYIEALSSLSQMYSDLTALSELPRSLQRWILWQTWPLAVLAVSGCIFLTQFMFPRISFPTWLSVVTLSVAIAGALLFLFLLIYEWRTRDQLVELLQRCNDG